MKLFYTGAPKYNTSQQFANASLGGFVSSSEIQNDVLNNIFFDESQLAVQNLKRTAVLIALVNDDDDESENVVLTFNTPDWTVLTAEYNIAFVSPKIDKCGDIQFDKINDSGALPYASFEVISSTNNSFNLGNMAAGQVIGIWLIRKILNNSNTQPLSPQQLYANYLNAPYTDLNTNITYNPIPVPAEEDFTLTLTWNPDESHSSSAS